MKQEIRRTLENIREEKRAKAVELEQKNMPVTARLNYRQYQAINALLLELESANLILEAVAKTSARGTIHARGLIKKHKEQFT